MLVLLVGYLGNQWMSYKFIFTNTQLIDYYQQKGLNALVLEEIMQSYSQNRWRYYLLNMVLVICKVLAVSVALSIGFELLDRTYSLITNVWIVICSEFLMLSYVWLKLYLLMGNQPMGIRQSLAYAPFSLHQIWGHQDTIWWYALGTLNLFQLAQAFVLFVLAWKYYKGTIYSCFKVCMASFGCCLLLWIVISTSVLIYAQDHT